MRMYIFVYKTQIDPAVFGINSLKKNNLSVLLPRPSMAKFYVCGHFFKVDLTEKKHCKV